MESGLIMNPIILDYGPYIEYEGKAEISILLGDQKLTRANKKLARDFNPIFGHLPPDSNSREAVITRLASIYEDPNYGPGYFQESAQTLKDYLILYKAVKNNTSCEMFYLNKTKTGIHIHFNTETRRKEVVIPVGCPGMDPVRIDIGMFRSWYKKQRVAAIAARIKAQEEISELRMKVAKASLDRANSCLEQSQAEVAMRKALLERYRKEKQEEIISKLINLRNRAEKEASKPKEYLLSQNEAINKLEAEKGMYEEKFLLEKIEEALEIARQKAKNVCDIYNSFTEKILLL